MCSPKKFHELQQGILSLPLRMAFTPDLVVQEVFDKWNSLKRYTPCQIVKNIRALVRFRINTGMWPWIMSGSQPGALLSATPFCLQLFIDRKEAIVLIVKIKTIPILSGLFFIIFVYFNLKNFLWIKNLMSPQLLYYHS